MARAGNIRGSTAGSLNNDYAGFFHKVDPTDSHYALELPPVAPTGSRLYRRLVIGGAHMMRNAELVLNSESFFMRRILTGRLTGLDSW